MVNQQDISELKNECLALERSDRAELYRAIGKSLIHQEDQDRYNYLMAVMEEIVGFPILENCRARRYTYARALIAHQLIRLEGYHLVDVARLMNKNHATVIYYLGLADTFFDVPAAYRDVINIWNQFTKKIQI